VVRPRHNWQRDLTGLAVLLSFLPVVLVGIFGGVIVDRLGFRTTSVVADLASAGAAAIPLLDSTVGIELWQLLALVFAGALLDAPGATARQALFPEAVELAGIGMERATGIRAGVQQGSFLVGGPIGGILVAGFGATNALWLDAASSWSPPRSWWRSSPAQAKRPRRRHQVATSPNSQRECGSSGTSACCGRSC
jgi:MFS family permease